NNTRIKFEDTSTSTGFPTTDWQLTANDSASGGANKFSIEDVTASTVPFTVTGAAPSNSIFVDSTGRVGLRTSVPGLDLHISTSNTPAIRQEQTSAGGFTAQTWDIGANEANWFVRDVTGGSRLPLRIRPGAPTSSVDISAAGNVGLSTATNSLYGRLQVSSTNPGMIGTFGVDFVPLAMYHNAARAALFYNAYNDTTDRIFFGTNRAASSEFNVSTGLFEIKTSTAAGAAGAATTLSSRISIDSSGNVGIGTASPTAPITHSNGATLSAGGVWTNASSRALKQDICDLSSDDAKSALEELNPVTYAYKVAPAEHHVGFIAEDVPDLVATQDRKGLSSMDVVAVLAKVVKDQQKTIDTLSQRLEQLEKEKK
ncbi:MAG: Chaperone of endosialidase, partial [Acidobacteria bacterium]|nr:Chaperone of endosialidase [Acidobacteriota bacterium]